MHNPFVHALLLTLAFSLCLCLIGPVGYHQDDLLSQWLIRHLSIAIPQVHALPHDVLATTVKAASRLLYSLLEWFWCLLSGVLAILGMARFPLSMALATGGGLMLTCLGLPVFIYIATGVLITSSAPILSVGFGVMTGYVLLRLRPMAHDTVSLNQSGYPRADEEPAIPSEEPHPMKQLAPAQDFFSPFQSDTNAPPELGNDPLLGIGRTIGRYEIIRPIGKGAMGEVFLGRDPHINRLTAIKTVHFEETFAADDIEQIKGKFFREAESAGTLSHPHIVTIYDAGEDGDSAYIAMEFLEGSTLLRFARRQRLLPLRRLIHYMVQVAEALEYAHSQGVIHRDIKPANIMLLQSRQIKITDFGIAHIATSSQTQTGVVKGTPYYMSPEQFSGQKVDGRSDIFSLGTTMFQLLTGTLPFYAESPALLMNQIMNFPHPNPRAINPRIIPAMVEIVDKTLAKDRENRYQTAKALALDLRRLDNRIKAALRKDRQRAPSGS